MRDVTETVTELKRQQSLGRIRQYGFCNFGEQDIKDFYGAGGISCSNQVITKLFGSDFCSKMGGVKGQIFFFFKSK